MTQFYTYIYRDPSRLNAKGFPEEIYVGKGKEDRSHYHLDREDQHPFVQRLQKMKRLGIAPSIEIINALDEDHAFFMEVCLIDVIGRKDLDKGPLLNLSNGGEGVKGWKPTDEQRAKMVNAKLGKPASPKAYAHCTQITVGRVRVTNGTVNKSVKLHEVDVYLAKGFVLGLTSKPRREMSEILGKIWVNDGNTQTRVFPSELANMPGFVNGRKRG